MESAFVKPRGIMQENAVLEADVGLKLLSLRRHENDQRLKGRFESIFEKYEYDFEGIGDEIDIVTGELLIDNGHLKNMRHEADPDAGGSSRQRTDHVEEPALEDATLELESDYMSGSETDHLDDADEAGEAGEHAESNGLSTGMTSEERGSFPDAFARPMPRLAQLLVDQQATSESTRTANSLSTVAVDVIQPTATRSESVADSLPQGSIMESLLRSNPALAQPDLDTNAIQALGLSIAAGLFKMMSKTPTESAEREEVRTAREGVWSYPEPGHAPQPKRKLSEAHDPEPERLRKRMSLWMPKVRGRPRKQVANEYDLTLDGTPPRRATTPPVKPYSDGDLNIQASDLEINGTISGKRKRRCLELRGAADYATSLTPSQDAQELSLLESLRSECASLGLQGGASYVRQEEVLLRMLKTRGMLWRDIAQYFPYRNRASIQNHWQRMLRPGAPEIDVDIHSKSSKKKPEENDGESEMQPTRQPVAAKRDEREKLMAETRDGSVVRNPGTDSVESVPEPPAQVERDGDDDDDDDESDQERIHEHQPLSEVHKWQLMGGSDLSISDPTTSRNLRAGPFDKSGASPTNARCPTGSPQPVVPSSSSNVALDTPDVGGRSSHYRETDQPSAASAKAPSPFAAGISAANGEQCDELVSVGASHSSLTNRGDGPFSTSPGKIHMTPTNRSDRARPEKLASRPSVSKSTPRGSADPRDGEHSSFKSARKSAVSTPSSGVPTGRNGTTHTTIQSPMRLKTPVARKSTVGPHGSMTKSIKGQHRVVETHVREIDDSEDELA